MDQIVLKEVLLVLMVAIGGSEQVYCGDVWVRDPEPGCVCGDNNDTQQEHVKKCGPIYCTTKNHYYTECTGWINLDPDMFCGDIANMYSMECQCGSRTLSRDDFFHKSAWCCPGKEACNYTRRFVDNTGVHSEITGVQCPTGTIIIGQNNSCDNQWCYSKLAQACKTGDQCVNKQDICHGYPVCMDKSDIKHCQEENDICGYDFSISRCHDIPSGHQECYLASAHNDRRFDCLSRSDEDSLVEEKATIDYD